MSLILSRTMLGLCFVFFSLSSNFSAAQTTPLNSSNQASVEKKCESINVASTEIICLYNGVGSFSVYERAHAIEDKIKNIASNRNLKVEQIQLDHHKLDSNIRLDSINLITLTEDDAAEVNKPRHALAEETFENIKKAINEARKINKFQSIIKGTAYTFFAIVTLLLLLLALSYIFSKLYTKINSYRGTKIRSIKIQSFELLTADRIVTTLIWLAQTTRVIVTLALFYFFIPIVLSFFPATAKLTPQLYSYILKPIKHIGGLIIEFIPNIFYIIVIIIAAQYLLKFIRFIFKEVEKGTLYFEGFHQDWAEPTYKLVRLLVLAFTFIMCFPYLPGSSSPAFQGISVFLGLLLSLGSSSAVSNMVSGIVITYMRPFKVGDRVKISDTVGDVTEKTLLVTRIRTIKNVDITVPNSMVLGSHIINYSTTAEIEGLILNTTVTIGYDVPWAEVHKALINAALTTEHICKDPKPFVLQTALNDFYVSYELNAFTREPNIMANVYSELHKSIQNSFNEAGIEIMSPHYTSVRDGNTTTIPANHLGEDYVSPKFELSIKQ